MQIISKYYARNCHNHFWLAILAFFFFLLIHYLCSLTSLNAANDLTFSVLSFVNSVHSRHSLSLSKNSDPCSGRYVYIHDLPNRFNEDLLKNCQSLIIWTNLCPSLSNSGFGRPLENTEGILSNSWYATNQFMLGIIFHQRMRKYNCLTNESALASAIYVPFYAGLEVGRSLWIANNTKRDAAAHELMKWLVEKPEWEHMSGRDHFLVSGRIAWDFRRQTDKNSDWGSNLLFLPESKNMTMLAIESSAWNNDMAIPYPTNFHPSSNDEISQWQNRMRMQERRYLFSFIGAPRPNLTISIRGKIFDQCKISTNCTLLDCSDDNTNCDDPVDVMKVFQNSVFCLQPRGDSYTRRSTFDSILAGCIPVFFSLRSAHLQYIWHLPADRTTYSVFIPEKYVSKEDYVEKTLLNISKEEETVSAMREEVLKLIPKVIYVNKTDGTERMQDAFDIAVDGILGMIREIRRDMERGRSSNLDFGEKWNWIGR